MAIMKQPAGLVRAPKMKAQPAPKPIKPIKPAKMPKPLKAPRLGGKR